MIGRSKVLAIIPARFGSQRLPKKNLMLLKGRPLVAWAIGAAKDSEFIDYVLVSTDDESTRKVALSYGASVPFLRPPELATSTASSFAVAQHALYALNQLGHTFEIILLLQPTSPLRTYRHIDAAINLFIEKKGDAVIGVVEEPHPIEWVNTLPEDCSMEKFFPPNLKDNSLDCPKRYRINGAIYLCRAKRFLEEQTFFLKDNIWAYVMKAEHSVDIDTELDFQFAEVLASEQ